MFSSPQPFFKGIVIFYGRKVINLCLYIQRLRMLHCAFYLRVLVLFIKPQPFFSCPRYDDWRSLGHGNFFSIIFYHILTNFSALFYITTAYSDYVQIRHYFGLNAKLLRISTTENLHSNSTIFLTAFQGTLIFVFSRCETQIFNKMRFFKQLLYPRLSCFASYQSLFFQIPISCHAK